jgi:ABC-2 type transport system ATP-binding protein
MYPLAVQNLKKVYGKKKPFTAVNEISFRLEAGEILGFLGPNGSGKTTTIQMLLGTLSPTSGSILYFGKDFSKYRSEVLQSVSFASTYTSLPYILTVAENLKCFGLYYEIEDAEKRTDPLLERFGILECKHKPIAALSAGQITRLMLVKAFFTGPKVVLLDEPTASLDPEISHEVCQFLLEERDRTGLSILFTSHKMEEVAELCDRTIFLKQGKIIADDVPERLAKSGSSHQLRLTVTDGMKRTVALAAEMGIRSESEHKVVTLFLNETEIPSFLNRLMQKEVSYANIQIKEPSLEDYFLKLAEENKI